jgi:hypothetical protein
MTLTTKIYCSQQYMGFYNLFTKTVRKNKKKHTEFNFHCISVKVLNVTVVKCAI